MYVYYTDLISFQEFRCAVNKSFPSSEIYKQEKFYNRVVLFSIVTDKQMYIKKLEYL